MFFMWYAAQGVSALKRIGSIAGSFMFIMSILYVLLVLAAPYINGSKDLLLQPQLGYVHAELQL